MLLCVITLPLSEFPNECDLHGHRPNVKMADIVCIQLALLTSFLSSGYFTLNEANLNADIRSMFLTFFAD